MSVKEKILHTKCLPGSTLKIIACISMFIDHSFHILWRTYKGYIATLDYDSIIRFQRIYRVGRGIGRLAFPIYCFLLVEGFFHTKNIKKYLLRLFIMAVLSEHAFNLLATGNVLEPEYQNVFLTLFISLVTISGMNKVRMREAFPRQVKSVLMMFIAVAGCVAAHLLKTDYSYNGVLSIVVIYLLHYNRPLTCLGGALSFTWEPWAIPAFVPIFLYDGRRGLKAKYIFYFFYPFHIYLIYFVVNYILPPTF